MMGSCHEDKQVSEYPVHCVQSSGPLGKMMGTGTCHKDKQVCEYR